MVSYKVDSKSYWVATDRFDLPAEQVALIYKLWWTIKSLFACWKRHLSVYHLIARSILRVRELNHKIRNEAAVHTGFGPPDITKLDLSVYATS